MERCKSCGAPLPESGKCQYCGSEYHRIKSTDDMYFTINFGGAEHECYLNSVHVDLVEGIYGRDVCGRMVGERTMPKYRFELIEL